ncbi:hypothetical protein M8J75_000885 [Diaphorina citri]|nr:hypothetical protein M8J75_000885 [Diaphorina citri]
MSREQEIIRNILDELLDGNDSDFSDLDDSGDEDELTLAAKSNEETVDQATEEVLNLAFSRLHWQPGNYEETPLDFVVVNSSEPPDPTKTPFQYFKDFVSDEMIQMLVEQNNLYSTQKNGISVNTTTSEIEQVLGMYLRMGIAQFPSVRSYWESYTNYPLISEVMPRTQV